VGYREAFSEADFQLLEELAIRESRGSFWAFRRYMNPKMKVGWWQQEVCYHLQLFYEDLVAGNRPQLVIEAPPQHGKSETIVDFLAWIAGKHPDLKQIYASYSDRLGVRANLKLQRMFDNPRYRRVFPKTRLVLPASRGGSHLDNHHVRSRELLEFVGQTGYFRNTTVRGSVTGEGLDLGAIDDPIKGRQEASSPTTRDSTWEWFTDDFFTRFSEMAALLIILTRWHVDDPVGRLQEVNPTLKTLKYPALAIEDELHRKKGEPLFPEHKSLDFLLKRKEVLLPESWESLYQQSPYIRSGGLFPMDCVGFMDHVPLSEVVSSVRYWDKAGTKEGAGARTAGVLMHKLRDGRYLVEDSHTKRFGALERERRIKTIASLDGYGVRVFVEQEPGSGGKESAESTVRNLAGWTIEADRPTGNKELRAEPFAAQWQAGNVLLLRGDWNKDYLGELEQFPNGALKDQVDASSGAFMKLTGEIYDIEALAS
jgi:predicted phage terminase large subunit-like protein